MLTFKKTLGIAVFSSALLAMGGGAFAGQSHIKCTSPAEVSPLVCFYTEANFKGNVFCEAGARTVNELKYPWKNNIESIKVIDGAFVRIYNKTNRNGDDDIVEHSQKELSSDFSNKVRSYRTGVPEQDEIVCTHLY